MKEIMIVASKQYKDFGRKLAHEVSKQPGCKGAFWSVKHYEDNEFMQGGERYAIFIGNSKENKLTKSYLSVIKNLQNQAGACFGFDGVKAVVYGEGKLEQKEEFEKVQKKCKDILENQSVPISSGVSIAVGSIVFLPSVWTIIKTFIIPRYIQKLIERKKLRKEQTKAAMTLFLAEHFDNWVGIEK